MGRADGAALRSATDERLSFNWKAPSARAFSFQRFRPHQSACPELEALRGRLPSAVLAHAEWRSTALNVGADRVLVAERSLADDDYLHCYAVQSGIAFEPLDRMPRAACPLDDDRMLDAVAAGILPCVIRGELVHVVAPRGFAARRLLQLTSNQPELRPRFRVTSTERLHRFVVRHCGAALGARAADALRTAAPLLSAAPRSRSSGAGRWWAIAGAVAAAAFVAAPNEALALVNVAFSLLFLGWMVLRLLGVFVKPPARPRRKPVRDAELPVYTVIAAIYREAASVSDLVTSISQIDWPPEKLDVKLVVEPDDLETRAAIARLDLAPYFEVIVAPAAGPRTKPKALNAALPFARGTFLVIYDAEDRPESDQLRSALDAFLRHDHALACVQAALTIDNTADSWLARMFTAEYAAHFDMLLPALSELRLPLPLGGSSNHFRVESLRAVGAWDPYNVTEDADLGMRLARFGYRSTVIASSTYEEAPARWRPWLQQRTRWFKGWTQTWMVHMRTPRALWRDLGAAGFAVFHLVVGGNVMAALIYPAFLALVARLIAGEPVFDTGLGGLHVLALLGGLTATAVSNLIGLARRDLRRAGWVVALAPLHWMLLSVAAWRGVLQLLWGPVSLGEDRARPGPVIAIGAATSCQGRRAMMHR